MKFDIWIFFENLSKKLKHVWNPTRIPGTLHADLRTFMIISRWILLLIRNVADSFVQKIKTHILCSKTFSPRKSFRLWDNGKKFCKAGQAIDDSMAHVYYMTDNLGYRHTLRICSTYCCYTVTVFKRTCLSVML